MPAQSIYGFAQAVSGGGSGVTAALRLYQRAISQGADENGVISNPDVYRQARDQYLAPFADDVRVSTKISDSQNDENQLRAKQDDVSMAASVFKQDVSDMMREYTKTYFNKPDSLVANSAFVYNQAVDVLSNEIVSRRESGKSVGDLQNLLNDYSDKADSLSKLTREIMAGGVRNPSAYGVFIKTNPDDGSIMDISVDLMDSTSQRSGYTQTNTKYGQIPVWTNVISTPDKGKIARIGDQTFAINNDTQILEKTKSTGLFGALASYFPGGVTPQEAWGKYNEGNSSDLNLNNIKFGSAVNLPEGSIMKDAGGTYYYQGKDGVFKASSKDALQKYINPPGGEARNIDEGSVFPVSRSEVKGFGAFTNADGTARIIDDTTMGGSSVSDTSGQQGMLPPMNQPVTGGFSANTPAPRTMSMDTPFSGGGQTPRKAFSVKTDRQIGIANTKDIVASEGKKFTSPSMASSGIA